MSSTDKNPKWSVPLKGRIHREDWGTVSLLELFHYDCAQDTASNVDSYSVYGLDENHLYGTVHAQGKEAHERENCTGRRFQLLPRDLGVFIK